MPSQKCQRSDNHFRDLRKGKTPYSFRVQKLSQVPCRSIPSQTRERSVRNPLTRTLPGEYQGEEARSVRYGLRRKSRLHIQRKPSTIFHFLNRKKSGESHYGNTDKVQDAKNNEAFLQEHPGAQCDKKPEKKDAGSTVHEF